MITVIGSVNMDLVVTLPEIPKIGETMLGGTFLQNPGGKGGNQAVAAAKVGSHVRFMGCVGDDGFGSELKSGMMNNGVDCSCLEIAKGVASGIALIQVDAQGRNNIAVASGANGFITQEQIDRHMDSIRESKVVVAQMEIPVSVVQYAMQQARACGCTTILNPSPATDLSEELIAATTIMTPNEHELARITGLDCSNVQNIEVAARALMERGVEIVIVTLGEKGVLFMENDICQIVPAHRVEAVDTTAAGDAFLGGFAHFYEMSGNVGESIDYGQRVAAFAVQHKGAQQSMPTDADLNL